MRFFFDENMPIKMLKALQVFGVDCVHLIKFYKSHGIADEDWMPVVGAKGWVVVTLDRRIYRDSAQHALARLHGLRSIVLTRSWFKLRQHEKAGYFLVHHDAIVERTRDMKPGDAVRLNTQGIFSPIPPP